MSMQAQLFCSRIFNRCQNVFDAGAQKDGLALRTLVVCVHLELDLPKVLRDRASFSAHHVGRDCLPMKSESRDGILVSLRLAMQLQRQIPVEAATFLRPAADILI